MTFSFFFGDHRPAEGNITKTGTGHGNSVGLFSLEILQKHKADLAKAIAGKPHTVLMPGLDCSPNFPVRTDFANFLLFFNRQALGYFGLVIKYHLVWKLEENLAIPYDWHIVQSLELRDFCELLLS